MNEDQAREIIQQISSWQDECSQGKHDKMGKASHEGFTVCPFVENEVTKRMMEFADINTEELKRLMIDTVKKAHVDGPYYEAEQKKPEGKGNAQFLAYKAGRVDGRMEIAGKVLEWLIKNA